MKHTHTPHSINTCTCKHTKIRHAKYGKEARNRTNEATPRKYHIGERQIESKSEANRNEKVNYYLSIIHSVLRTKDSRQYKQFVTVVEIPNKKKKIETSIRKQQILNRLVLLLPIGDFLRL